jgi:LysM repeat protein
MYIREFSINKSIIVFLCAIATQVSANKKLIENYISTYQKIAVSEMRRSGIPASIKLAQGLLESDLGRSPITIGANNHFGIKCGKEWSGPTYYKHDDDTDSDGLIIESCFRAYSSGEESYIAHSDFLTNPSKQSRYGFLFNLSTTDYVGWANGLKFAGYASDPSYPAKLIKIIETYHLDKLDEPIHTADMAVINQVEKRENQAYDHKKVIKQSPESEKTEDKGKVAENEKKSYIGKYKTEKINDLKVVRAFGGETIKELALRNKKNVFELLEFNEGYESQDIVLSKDEMIFLEKKKKSTEDINLAFHTVIKGESLFQIAQKYGIRLENIRSKNNLPNHAEPMVGEIISLSRNLSKKESPKYRIVEKSDDFIDFGGLQ